MRRAGSAARRDAAWLAPSLRFAVLRTLCQGHLTDSWQCIGRVGSRSLQTGRTIGAGPTPQWVRKLSPATAAGRRKRVARRQHFGGTRVRRTWYGTTHRARPHALGISPIPIEQGLPRIRGSPFRFTSARLLLRGSLYAPLVHLHVVLLEHAIRLAADQDARGIGVRPALQA